MVGINFQRISPLCVLNYSFFKANHIIYCVQLCYGMLYFFRSFINLDESKFFLSLKYYVGLRTKVIGVEHSFNHIQKVINTIIANQIQLLDKVFHRIYEVRYIFFV